LHYNLLIHHKIYCKIGGKLVQPFFPFKINELAVPERKSKVFHKDL